LEQKKLDRGGIVAGQYELRLDNGSFLWVEYRSRAILAEDGKVSGYLLIHHDITGRKLMEADIALVAKMPGENPSPVMRFRPDGEVVYANDASQPLMDFWKRQKQGGLPDMVLNGIRKAFESGIKQEVEIEYDSRTLTCTLAPIQESGYVNFYANDVTKRKRAERGLKLARTRAEHVIARMTRLQKVTAALSETLTPAQVARVIIEQGIPTSNARTGTIMTLSDDGRMLEIIYTSSPEKVTRPYQRFPVTSNVPAANALRSGQPVWIKSRQDYQESYPHLTDQINDWGLQAAVAIPLVVNDRKFGVLGLSFARKQKFNPEEQDFILTLAQQTAQALDRASLFQKVIHALSELQKTYDQSPIGMIQLDTDLRYIRINEKLAHYNGIPVSDHIGKTIHEIVPNLAPKVEEGFRKVIETGIPVLDVEVVAETSADLGVPHTWLESWFPLRDEAGQIRGLNIVVQDISQRKHDEQALREYARQQTALYKLADRLHRRNTMKGIFDAALDAILDAFQCDRASILLFDEAGVIRFVAWHGLSEAYRKATDGNSPWKSDEKKAQPIAYDDIQKADLDDELKTIIAGESIGSLAFIPLVYEEKLIGKFTVYFNEPHTFNNKEVELSLTIGRQIAFGLERKRTEDLLRNERELLARLFETMPVMISMYDPATKTLRVNSLFEKLIGWKNGELDALSSLENFYPDPEYRAEVLQKMAECGPNEWVEVRVHTRDGGTLESLWSNVSILDDQQQLVTGIAIGVDNTERKRAEQDLRASESLYRAIARSIPAGGVYVVNKDYRYIVAEGPVTEAFGLTRERLEGHTIEKVFSSEQTASMEERLKKNFAGETVNYETEHNGRVYWTHQAPLLDSLGHVIILTLDITERKQMEDNLRKSREKLQEFNETLERKVRAQTAEIRSLASDLTKAEQHERNRVSHILHDDLQQRLYAAKIHVTILHDEIQEGTDGPMYEELAAIKTQLDGAVTLARNLSIELSPPILQGEGLAQAIQWLASHMKETYGLSIEVQTKDAFAIPDQDVQVLLFNCVRELLFNIVKHADTDLASVQLDQVNSHLQIDVRDHGKGFDLSDLGSTGYKIGTDEKGRKRSFGLPTIRHQLSLFGGQFDIRSKPGDGTHVTIMMPIENNNGQ
jgi:PAS domain S-box-containing protein